MHRRRHRSKVDGSLLEDLESAPDEIVEIEATMLRERPLVRDEGTRDRPGAGVGRDVVCRHGQVELQPRERGVEAAPLGRRCPRPQVGDRARRGRSAVRPTGRHRGGSRDPGRGTSARGRSPAPHPSGSSAAWARSPSSSAARLLNVIAAIVAGSTPPSTSHAIRATKVVVLPLPAGATHRTGPGGAVAAVRWSGVSRESRSWTAGWSMRRTIGPGVKPPTHRRSVASRRPAR